MKVPLALAFTSYQTVPDNSINVVLGLINKVANPISYARTGAAQPLATGATESYNTYSNVSTPV